MAADYKVVGWTPYKKAHDVALAIGVVGFLAAFVAATLSSIPPGQSWSEPQLALRALGACAFALLSLILMIGPLARLAPKAFLPLLYNRRHLGVTCFFLALLHAVLATVWYHAFSDADPLVSLLASNPRYDSIQGFPFESLGLAALLILFMMAATSHDFWNANLGPRTWKAIHIAVYPAYALIVGHVLLGAIQTEKSPIYPAAVGAAAFTVAVLHLVAGLRETARDRDIAALEADGWLRVGEADDIPDKRARIVTPDKGERIAVFRDGGRVFALSNVCRHQGGPLGEGRIIDGCVTCPWHGYQYRPEDGRSPAPYTEKVATYRARALGRTIFVHPEALPPGTEVPPAEVQGLAP